MAQFLFVYRGCGNTEAHMTPEEMQQNMKKWEAWIGEGMQKGWMLNPGDAPDAGRDGVVKTECRHRRAVSSESQGNCRRLLHRRGRYDRRCCRVREGLSRLVVRRLGRGSPARRLHHGAVATIQSRWDGVEFCDQEHLGTQVPKETCMRVRAAFASFAFVAFVTAAVAGQDQHHLTTWQAKNAAFEQFKALAGEWVGKRSRQEGPRPPRDLLRSPPEAARFVVEDDLPRHRSRDGHHDPSGTGDDILLAALLHAGQPAPDASLRQGERTSKGRVETSSSGLPETRSRTKTWLCTMSCCTFVDSNTLRSEWTHFKDGKDSGRVVFELKRKK